MNRLSESRRPDPTEGEGGQQLQYTGELRSNTPVSRVRSNSLCVILLIEPLFKLR